MIVGECQAWSVTSWLRSLRVTGVLIVVGAGVVVLPPGGEWAYAVSASPSPSSSPSASASRSPSSSASASAKPSRAGSRPGEGRQRPGRRDEAEQAEPVDTEAAVPEDEGAADADEDADSRPGRRDGRGLHRRTGTAARNRCRDRRRAPRTPAAAREEDRRPPRRARTADRAPRQRADPRRARAGPRLRGAPDTAERRLRRYDVTSRTFPMWPLSSTTRCAAAASLIGNSRSTIGRT